MPPLANPSPSAPPTEEVRRTAIEAGFDRVGFARAGPAPQGDRFREWLERGYGADMDYLARNAARRLDPRAVVAGARTVIALALHYGAGGREEGSARSGAESEDLAARGRGEVARYARGTDYHRLLEGRLRPLCAELARRHPGHRFRYYVDTGPVLERSWAQAAGLGWIGKNCCAIDPLRGSYFFIAVIISTLELEPDPPAADHCGSCRLCLEACPTGALVEPYRLDSRRCLSYLTIENRGPIPEELRPALGGLVFGCDICQEVCPFNRPDRLEGDPALASRAENLGPGLESLAGLEEGSFAARFPRSAVRRAKARGFLRNVLVALGNSGREAFLPLLERLSRTPRLAGDPVLAEALAWARKRIAERGASPEGRAGT